MKINKYGQQVYKEIDLLDSLMSLENIPPGPFIIEDIHNVDQINQLVGRIAVKYPNDDCLTINEFDIVNQTQWFMPTEYKELDIAKYVLDLCDNQDELQRCGEELLMYQDRDLFDLLRYLVYLVDIMQHNNIIWGVGRGSSVASFVLYKLNVHKINSMYFNLSIGEFLR